VSSTTSAGFGIRGKVHFREDAVPTPQAPRKSRWIWWVIALLNCYAFWQFSSAGYIHAKALVAQHLIAKSWIDARASGQAPRPWPWADTRPVARLTVAARKVDLYVLEGTSGRSLAFGPGHVSGTAAPGSNGNSVIVAHRDTHFAFLRSLSGDEEIRVEDAKGRVAKYRVREVVIVDREDTRVLDAADSPQLTLITCYPFDAVAAGTPLRYVVVADRVA
jgi:sortase A